jgi:hypothetical protein
MIPRSTTNKLSWAWNYRIRRVLFFSYRFSFRWFHNDVLSFIRKSSSEDAEVTIFATRFEEEAYAGSSRVFGGDLYSLDEWAKWKGRLRIRYLPKQRHLFHNKFILLEFEGRRGVALGLGSSNLTSSGWMENFETWNWNASGGISACADFLQYLSRFQESDSELVLSWVRAIRKLSPRPARISWLFGDKTKTRKSAFRALTRGPIGNAKVLRIVSPYFDTQSPKLFKELVAEIQRTAGKLGRVELWIDGSARIARRSDYETVFQLLSATRMRTIEIRTVKKSTQTNVPNFRVPLHAKIIELEGTTGRVNRILGSANFTGAAWLKKGNTETIFLESGQQSLAKLLPPDYDSLRLTRAAIRHLMRTAKEDEKETPHQDRLIYWASFDEQQNPPILTVSYESKDLPIDYKIEAHFDNRHTELTPEKAKSIIKAFENPKNWSKPQIDQSLVRVRCQKRDLQFPEYMRVVLVFSDGSKVGAPVEAINPDFANIRDPATGIPLEASLETLLGARKTIVRPFPKKSTVDATEGDEGTEGDDANGEEDVPEVPWAPESLSEDPDFDRQPLAVRFAKLLSDARKKPALAKKLQERLTRFTTKIDDPAERMLARAVQHTLQNKRV